MKGMKKIMANKWTDEQMSAISHTDSSIIVSAAAGSGKTAVLVERILRKISGENKSTEICDINKLLVVTFTNAAASEMRGKISAAISKMLAKDPRNMRMRRQLALMTSANIQTVHSFCLQLIRDNFHLTGLQSDFSILDDVTGKMMKNKAMEEVLEENYSQENNLDSSEERDNFALAVRWFSSFKSDVNFQNVVLEIYQKLKSHADMFEWMNNIEKKLAVSGCGNAGETVWGAYILKRAEENITYAKCFLKHALEEMESCPDVQNAYGDAFRADMQSAENIILKCRCGDWDGVFEECCKYVPQRLNPIRKFEDKEFLESIKADREVWKDAISGVKNKLVSSDSQTVISDILKIGPVIKGIFGTIRKFEEKFAAMKLEKNTVDYNDLEHIALKLLIDENGEKTSIAQEFSERFSEIMVDEYQDTNEVQDAIFSAISKNYGNLFMVGDVKQSIYGFRLADPSIFLQKYLSYKSPSEAVRFEPVSISMSKNFRSRKQVLDTVNLMFKALMSENLGDINYTEREALHPGAAYPNESDECYDTDVYILDTKTEKDSNDNNEEDAESKDEKEANFVAGKIKQLIDNGFKVTEKDGTIRNAQSRDFAILLRANTNANIYKNALAALSIAAVTEEKASFVETAEIISMMSILKTINNFSDDTYIVAAMRSPAYAFSPDELAEIRIANPELRFFEAVMLHSEINEKCRRFTEDMMSMRREVGDVGISRLIWNILTEKRLLSLFGETVNGEQRKNNLLALYQCAVSFENTSVSSDLGAFINYMDELQNENSAPPVQSQSEDNGVKIMTIHKSKGLEFPIVIVPSCAKKFNEDDTKNPVLFHSKLGLGLKIRNFQKFTEYPSVMRNAVSDMIRVESLSEELRILYVALTRAKEKLIITMAFPDAEKKIGKWTQNIKICGMSANMLKAEHSPAMWIAAPLIQYGLLSDKNGKNESNYHINVNVIKSNSESEINNKNSSNSQKNAEYMSKYDTLLNTVDDDIIADGFNYVYPYKDSALIPSKITATELNRASNLNRDGTYTGRKNSVKINLPDFIKEKTLSSTEKGIANHLAMQFIHFDRCGSDEEILSELERLKNDKILSEKQYSALNKQKILQFFKTSLFNRILKSENIRKEFKFSMFVPAKDYFTSLSTVDNILLQGVVDCMFEEDGQIVILDFKSDDIPDGFEEKEAQNYKKQLEVYAYAMKRVTGKPVKERIIYFLKTGKVYSF